ncbi:hypothetical protein NGB30_01625 [Mammaliicoccus fleurettii]|uniref:hypothetical protein n=1 Tax=Mammaliicoccus fleurettii TaxID=150056 RepID=UPI002DC00C7C|nr:hypothetical protein [Mammaliicoccus fleurettii]MEB7779231.1 hypothetical protein [Mammaliicoccus fleurettii]
MTTTWNIIKYPMLTLLVVVEFFVIASFSSTPVEHSFMFWIVTVAGFEMFDQLNKEVEGE